MVVVLELAEVPLFPVLPELPRLLVVDVLELPEVPLLPELPELPEPRNELSVKYHVPLTLMSVDAFAAPIIPVTAEHEPLHVKMAVAVSPCTTTEPRATLGKLTLTPSSETWLRHALLDCGWTKSQSLDRLPVCNALTASSATP